MEELGKKSIGQYKLGKTIGEGTFGKVRIGTHTLTGEKVAIKILEKERVIDVSDVERVAREIHILKIIRHPYIIQLYEIIETKKELYLIMEYATGGELYNYIVTNTRLNELEACRIFQQIISGVEYLHKLKIVHRDLKPENLLLNDSKDVKLVDFGLSNTYKKGEQLSSACGSPCYAAPEMIAGKKYDGLQADIWSAGVVLFTLLCGYLPFENRDTSILYKKILSGKYEVPSFVSDKAKDFIKGILTVDPLERSTIEDIRNHSWYKIWQTKVKEGIIVGLHQIPVEPLVLKQLEQYNINIEDTRKCVEANKHNADTTTYYLLLQKFVREGGKTAADLASPLFEPVTIGNYLRVPLSKTKESPLKLNVENISTTKSIESKVTKDSLPKDKYKPIKYSTIDYLQKLPSYSELVNERKKVLNGSLKKVNKSQHDSVLFRKKRLRVTTRDAAVNPKSKRKSSRIICDFIPYYNGILHTVTNKGYNCLYKREHTQMFNKINRGKVSSFKGQNKRHK